MTMTNKRFIHSVYRGALLELCSLSKTDHVTVAAVLERDKGYKCFDKISVGEMFRCGEGGPLGEIEDIDYADVTTWDGTIYDGVVFVSARVRFSKDDILDWCGKGFEEVEGE